jgi:poly-gamma-glutamate synthesis protein (capsule biosynthesis protein)
MWDRPVTLFLCGDVIPMFDPATGRLVRLSLTPTRIGRFRVNLANEEEANWLAAMLEHEGRGFGMRVERRAPSRLVVSGF